MNKNSLVSRRETRCDVPVSRAKFKALLFAAAAGLALAAPPTVNADVTVPNGEIWTYSDPENSFGALDGTVRVPSYNFNTGSTAVVRYGDVSPNNYIISGGGAPPPLPGDGLNVGALRIYQNSVVSGNVTIDGDASISSHETLRTGSVGTISGSIIGISDVSGVQGRLTFGVWNRALTSWDPITGETLENQGGAFLDPGYSPRGTIILLGDNSRFTGDIRIARYTTLQIGNGGITGNLAGDNKIFLTKNSQLVVDRGGTVIIKGDIATYVGETGTPGVVGNEPGEIVKRGPVGSVLTLTGNNAAFTGPIVVESGTLAFTTLASLGSVTAGAPKVKLHGGAVLNYTGTAAELDFGANFAIELVSRGTAILNIPTGTIATLQRLTAVGAGQVLDKTGAGTLVLGGTLANTNAGWRLDAGILELNKMGVFPAVGVGGLTIAGGTTRITGETGNQIDNAAPVVINNAGILDLLGHSEAIGSLSGTAASRILSTGDSQPENPALLTIGSVSNDTTFDGKIEGNISILKTGSSTLTLSGRSTYSGETTVSGGTLWLKPGAWLGHEANLTAITVETGATLAVEVANTSSEVSPVATRDIVGGGNFLKAGNGSFDFNAAPAYTGATIVRGGTLHFTSTNDPGTSAIEIASGSEFSLGAGNGTLFLAGQGSLGVSFAGHIRPAPGITDNKTDIGAHVTLGNAHTLRVGGAETVDVLNILNTLKFSGGTTLQLTVGQLGDTMVADIINANGIGFTDGFTGKVTLDVLFPDGVAQGDYPILQWKNGTALTSSDIDKFQIIQPETDPGNDRGGAYINTVVNASNKRLILQVTGDGNHALLWREGSGDWELKGSQSWEDTTVGGGGSAFYNLDIARFDDRDPESATITVRDEVKPMRVVVAGDTASKTISLFSLSGGKISGSTGLVKSSYGPLYLSGANDFVGVVDLRYGETRVLADAFGALPIGNYGDPSAIGAGTSASSIVLSSAASLVIANTGATALLTNRSFTVGSLATGTTGEGSIVVDASSTWVWFNGTEAVAFQGTGARRLTLGGNSGSWNSDNANGGAVFSLKLLDNSATGPLSLVKEGSGVWYLDNTANDYTGGTFVNGGALSVSNIDALGREPTAVNTAWLSLNGGTLANYSFTNPNGDGSFTTGRPLEEHFVAGNLVFTETRGIRLGADGGTLDIASDTSIRIESPIAGGRLIKAGGGDLYLDGENTFSGGFIVRSGNVYVGNAEAIPHGDVSGAQGSYGLHLATVLHLNGHNVTISQFVNAAGVASANQGSGGKITNSIGNAILTIGGQQTVSSTVFRFDGALNETQDGKLALVKRGKGRANLILTDDANNYSGGITVEEGILRFGLANTPSPYAMGNSQSIVVQNGATLDLHGSSAINENGLRRTLTIGGEGILVNNDDLGLGSGGALTISGRIGALLNTSDLPSYVEHVVIADSTRITGRFALGNIEGLGDLTLGSLRVEADDAYFYAEYLLQQGTFAGTPSKIYLEQKRDINGNVTAAGALHVEQTLNLIPGDINGGGLVRAPGGVDINGGAVTLGADELPGRNLIDPVIYDTVNDVPVERGKVAISIAAGTLYFAAGTRQEIAYLRGTSSADLYGTGTIVVNPPAELVNGVWQNKLPAMTAIPTAAYTVHEYTTFAGYIEGAINFIKEGPGTYTLSGRYNTFTGQTVVRNGTLQLAAPLYVVTEVEVGGEMVQYLTGVLGDVEMVAASQLQIGSLEAAATLRDATTELSYTNRLFTIVGKGATLESSGGTDDTKAVSGSGLQFRARGKVEITNQSAATGGATLTLAGNKVGAGIARNLFVPALTDYSSYYRTKLVKAGPGEWAISGANTYTGGTFIENGILTLESATAFPKTTLGGGTALSLGTATTAGALCLGGFDALVTSISANALGTKNAIYDDRAPKAYNKHPNFTVDIEGIGTAVDFTGSIGDTTADAINYANKNAFHFVKIGMGTFTLSGAALQSGVTEVREGVLAVAGNIKTFASPLVFINTEDPELDVPPVLDASALGTTGFTVNKGTTLVAGTPARVIRIGVDVDGEILSRHTVELDTVADLRGNYTLAGGALFVGGTREDKEIRDSDGILLEIRPSVIDKIASTRIAGTLASTAGTISEINFTFGSVAAVEGQNENHDTELEALASLPVSDYLDVDRLALAGIVNITPRLQENYQTLGYGYRLEAGTAASPASYEIIKYSTRTTESASQLRYGIRDPRYTITFVDNPDAQRIYMNVVSVAENDLYWRGTNSAQWGDPSAAGTNFWQALPIGMTSYAPRDHAWFDESVDNGEPVPNPALRRIFIAPGGVELGAATFNNAAGEDHAYTLLAVDDRGTPDVLDDISAGSMTGAGYLEKLGAGTLYIQNVNLHTGGVILSAGTIVVQNTAALGSGPLFLQGGRLTTTVNLSLDNELAVQGSAILETTSGRTITLRGALTDGLTDAPTGQTDGVLTKTGPGNLVLIGDASTYAGTIRVDDGVLLLGESANAAKAAFVLNKTAGTDPVLALNYDSAAVGGTQITVGSLAGNGTVSNNTTGDKTLVLGSRAEPAAAVFTGTVKETGGTVSLVKVGTGTQVIGGANIGYTGTTTVNAGTLQIGYNNTNASIGAGAINIGSAGTLLFNGDRVNAFDLAQEISGNGTLEKQNTNSLYILATNAAFNGTVVISDGELHVGKGNATGALGNATIVNNATLVFNFGPGNYEVPNNISGVGDIQKKDAGRLLFLGENTSTGPTIIYNGTFAIGNGETGKNLGYASSNVTLSNGAIFELNPGPDAVLTLSAGVSGVGTIQKQGAGKALLVGVADLSGTIQVQSGILQIGNGGNAGTLGGGTQIRVNNASELWIDRAGTVVFDGRVYSSGGRILVKGGTSSDGRNVIFSENNDIEGRVEIENHATLQIGNGASQGSFNSRNAAVTVTLQGTNSTLAFDRDGLDASTGAYLTINGAGGIVKRGQGTLTLNSQSRYTGATIVEAGRLIVDTSDLPTTLGNAANGFTVAPEHAATAYVAANGTGTLELRNGSTPYILRDSIRGNGIVALGANETISGGTRTLFNFASSPSSSTLSAFEVGASTTLNLGTNPLTRISAAAVNVLEGGRLEGQGVITGNLSLERGGEVSPGNSPGRITATGDVISAGDIIIEFERDQYGSFLHDSIHYAGTATFLNGAKIKVDLSNLGTDLPAFGTKFQILVDDLPSADGYDGISGSYLIGDELYQYGFIYNDGKGLTLLFGTDIGQVPGIAELKAARPDLIGFIDYLDAVLAFTRGHPNENSVVTDVVTKLLDGDRSVTIPATAPSGLAATTAMTVAAAHENAASTRSHLESIRYDRVVNARLFKTSQLTGFVEERDPFVNINAKGIQTYVSGGGAFVKNGSDASDPNFDFNSYSGLVGIDFLLGEKWNLGINAGYNRGKATLDSGGKVEADAGRATLYASFMPSPWVYFDAQLYGGYSSYETSRTTALGFETAKPDGYDLGASVYVGTVIPLAVKVPVHFTPFAGFEYVHSTVSSFTEDGSLAALNVSEIQQDSLLLRFGTGLNWVANLTPSKSIAARFALDAAFAVEVMDTDSAMQGAFANDHSGNKFHFEAPARPERTFQVGPSVEFSFGYNHSVSVGYTYETDFADYTSHALSATYRLRF